jgi:serine/threonine protein kinase
LSVFNILALVFSSNLVGSSTFNENTMNNEYFSDDPTLLDTELDQLLKLAPDAQAQRLIEIEAQNPKRAESLRAWLLHKKQSIENADGSTTHKKQEIPTQIGPWRIVRLIGRGGMGEVYLGERADGAFTRQVAIKFLRPDRVTTSKQLNRERQVLARLRHPGIAQLLDGGVTSDDRPYLIMEWVDGTSLNVWVKDKNPDLRQRVNVLKSAAEAVAYAHANLVVHRDLKSDNVMVDQNGSPRLLDFGIARLLEETKDNTLTDDRALTPAIAAPEQFTGQAVTTQTDVYALGGLLYWLISGQLPHDTKNLALADIIQKVCHVDPPAPSTLAKLTAIKINADLDAIALKALSREPENRYASAESMAKDLNRWLNGEAVSARLPTHWERARRFIKQNKLAVGLTMAIFASLFAGITTTLWQAQRAAQEAQNAEQEAKKAATERDIALLEAERSETFTKVFAQLFRNTENDEKLSASEWLDRATEIITKPDWAGDDFLRARFLQRLAEIENDRSRHSRAQVLYEKILGQYSKFLNTSERARAHCRLGSIYAKAERLSDANSQSQQGITLAESLVGSARIELVDCLDSRAGFALASNKATETDMAFAKRALSELEKMGNEKELRWRRSSTLYTLATLLDLSGKFPEALKYYEEVITIDRELGKTDTSNFATVLATSAYVLQFLDRLQDAKTRFEESIAISEKIGAASQTYASTLITYAGLLNTLGNPSEAAAKTRQALAILNSLKGESLLTNKALAYQQLGTSLAMLGDALGSDHAFSIVDDLSRTSTIDREYKMAGLAYTRADAQLSLGKYSDARKNLAIAMNHFRSKNVPRAIASSLRLLTNLELAEGNNLAAKSAAEELAMLLAGSRNPNSRMVSEYRLPVAETYFRTGLINEANLQAHLALPNLERIYGPQHKFTLQARALIQKIKELKHPENSK